MVLHVDPCTLGVLGRASLDGPALRLTEQLDRRSYQRVAKVIEAAGGRWDKKAQAHLFEGLAQDGIEQVLLTGQVTSAEQEFGAFFTPPEIAARVVDLADLKAGMRVLEPSAGRGALAAPALLAGCHVDCVEIDPANVHVLCSTRYRQVVEVDFLTRSPRSVYDRVLMNPPFARQRDIEHVRHAAKFLRVGGRLVAIMSAALLYRTDRRTEALRRLIVEVGRGIIVPLPDECFRSAGTLVRTALVTFEATAELDQALRAA